MGHLVDYEEATNEKDKALTALTVAEHKSSKSAAWSWAETAAEHAQSCGIENAEALLGSGRYPLTEPLRKVLQAL